MRVHFLPSVCLFYYLVRKVLNNSCTIHKKILRFFMLCDKINISIT